MSDPVIIDCPVDVWTKVATNKFSGVIKALQLDPSKYYETYRATGTAAPTLLPGETNNDAYPWKDELIISDSTGIDVYVTTKGKDGRVRVDA